MSSPSITLRRAATALAVASLVSLTACSSTAESSSATPSVATSSASASESATPSPSPSPSVSVSASPDLSLVKVSDEDIPVITVPAPWGIESTQTEVLREGGEQLLTATSTVTINYVGVNGTTGEIFDSSYDYGQPATFSLEGVVTGFQKGLEGQAVGSRVLIGMPSADGYPDGTSDGSINPGDSLLFVVDIISANFDDVTGETVTPAAGLPTVTMTDGKPDVTIPADATAPTDLVVQPLVKGPGAEITADSTLQVRYRAWTFADGELWQDAWQLQEGALSGLITGWSEGLLGQTAGSRVMLIIPPDMAFPDGLPSATPSLAAGQTLVYVIDVLNVT